jgi:hypothetical protein
MSPARRLSALAVVAALALTPLLPAAQDGTGKPPPATVSIEKLRIGSIASDRLRFSAMPKVVPREKGTIRQVSFHDVRIGGIPVYIPPVTEELSAQPGVPLAVSKPLLITVYFRDLESVEPLVRMIEDGKATVSGMVLVDIGLNAVQKLVLWTRQPVAPVRFETTLPLEIPPGPFGSERLAKASAVGLLRAADTAAGWVKAGRRRISPDDEKQILLSNYQPYLLAIEARHSFKGPGGSKQQLRVTGAAVRIDETRFLTTGEMLDPWGFDPVLGAQLESGGWKQDKGAFQLLVWPLERALEPGAAWNESRAVRSSEGAVRLVKRGEGKPTLTALSKGAAGIDKKRFYERSSPANIAVWEFRGVAPGVLPSLAGSSPPGFPGPGRVAVFRLLEDPETRTLRAGVVFLAAHEEKDRIRFEDPVDRGAFGLPAINGDGIAGLVQEDTSATALAAAMRLLDVKSR